MGRTKDYALDDNTEGPREAELAAQLEEEHYYEEAMLRDADTR